MATELPFFMENKYVDENGVKWTKSRCFFCHCNCLMRVGVDQESGRIVEIQGDPTEGTVLCDRMGPNGEKAIQMHYHPKRINHVLKRAGKRGEDKWEEIPYDQALDEIAEKLAKLKEEFGPETLCVSEGTYRSDALWTRSRFVNLFGNPGNIIDPGTVCWCWNYTINMSMTGWPLEAGCPADPMSCNTFVVWGKRLSECYGPKGPVWRMVEAAFNRPGKKPVMINIDPTCTRQSVMADTWLAIRPGTDLMMMLAWINHIIYNNLYDEDFLRKWTNAVFLVRKDTMTMLRASEVASGQSNENFVVWDEASNGIKLWNSDKNRYFDDGAEPNLYGEYEVELADGSTVACMTAFEALKGHIAEYTVERAAELCGVPESQIVHAVTAYATNGPAYIAWGLGGGDQSGYNAAYTAVAKTILRMLTGNIDNPGGEYIGDPAPNTGNPEDKQFPMRESELELADLVSPEAREKFIGNDQFRIMSWQGFEPIDKAYRKMWGIPRPQVHQLLCSPTLVWDAIEKGEPYPIKALICWSSNPMCWAPNTKHVYEALKKLDLLVVLEYWKTPTAALADYIIPVTDCLERPFCGSTEDSTDIVMFGDRAAEPVGDRRTDFDFFRGLGVRLGQEEEWPFETYEDSIAYRLERVPEFETYNDAMNAGMYMPGPTRFLKHEETMYNGQVRGFATVSRKCEIWPTLFEDLGYSPLPFYRELPETPVSQPELAREYPLRLAVGGRVATLYHSEFRVPGQGTRSMYPYPTVHINMEDARELEIRDGDWVWIETPRGRIRQVAQVDFGIIKGTVQAQPSWWYPELPAEEPWNQGIFFSGGNVLTDDAVETLDLATGNWVNRGLLCKVYPCIDPADRLDQYVTGDDFAKGNTFFDKIYKNIG